MGPVHTPAAVTIHSENQQKARQHHKQQETTKTKQTKQNTPKTSNVKSDRRSSSETIDEGEVMHCINSGIGMAENKTKEKPKTPKTHRHTAE